MRGTWAKAGIVASSATDGDAQEYFRGCADQVVDVFEHFLDFINRLVLPEAQPIVTCRNNRFGRWIVQFVAGKLFFDKLIVWLVVVKRLDDIIAVSPDERLRPIPFVAVCFRISN